MSFARSKSNGSRKRFKRPGASVSRRGSTSSPTACRTSWSWGRGRLNSSEFYGLTASLRPRLRLQAARAAVEAGGKGGRQRLKPIRLQCRRGRRRGRSSRAGHRGRVVWSVMAGQPQHLRRVHDHRGLPVRRRTPASSTTKLRRRGSDNLSAVVVRRPRCPERHGAERGTDTANMTLVPWWLATTADTAPGTKCSTARASTPASSPTRTRR